ncbi:arylsulfatase [Botrimarina sp.]|uniref:arylsulfatase n=1 Tax=Botrimarina sp. TaxID=2795802 RepID=UPI0032EBC7F9
MRNLTLCLLIAAASAGWGADRPNVLLVMCDDMGWSDLGCYGGEVETPNVDRLADEGMRFTQFYNNAKCTTTRASIITGLYPRGGSTHRYEELLRDDMLTVAEMLAPAGYRCSLVGKWHLGRGEGVHPLDRGFHSYYGLLDGACNFFDPARPDPPYKGGRVRYFADGRRHVTEFPEDFYTTTAFTDRAIDEVRRGVESDGPFFLHVCYTAPHYPLHAWPEDIAKYRGRYIDGWPALRERRFARQKELGVVGDDWRLSPADSRAYDWRTADHDFEDHRMAVYAAMIDRMDREVGRLLSELDRLGVADDTLVLFLSDNGGCAEEPGGRDPAERNPGAADDYVAVGPAWGWAQNTPFRRYKSWMHEGGVRTPLIARWPGQVPAGSITDQVGHIIDLAPTLVDLAEADPPRHRDGARVLPLEGRTLAPVLAGGDRQPPEELAWDFFGNAAIRQGDWKLVWDKLVGQWELYDLGQDPTEMNNLAADEPDRVEQLARAYNAWAKRTENTSRPGPGEF